MKNFSTCLFGRKESEDMYWCVEMSVLMPADYLDCDYYKEG